MCIRDSNRGHGGVVATVAKFRNDGFWATHAIKLAKSVKNSCVICRYLDHKPLFQTMGLIPKERLVAPVAWGHVEIDLFGPMECRSDVNKRATIKVWAVSYTHLTLPTKRIV